MGNLWALENYVNVTKGWRHGDSGWQETFADNPGDLYRALVREHGRCVSKMYRDRDGKPPIVCGWVFQKRRQYDDCSETYLAETWVEVSTTPPHKHCEWQNVTSPFEGNPA